MALPLLLASMSGTPAWHTQTGSETPVPGSPLLQRLSLVAEAPSGAEAIAPETTPDRLLLEKEEPVQAPDPGPQTVVLEEPEGVDPLPGRAMPEARIPEKTESSEPGEEPVARSAAGKATDDSEQFVPIGMSPGVAEIPLSGMTEEALYRKARWYHRCDDQAMAIAMYREVLKKNPVHGDSLFHLASIYMDRAAYGEAFPLLLDLLDQDPENPDNLVNLAVSEISLGRPENALPRLKKAMTLSSLSRAAEFRVCLHMALALSRLGMREEALECYKKAEALDPGHPRLLFNMAVHYDTAERYHEALSYYGRFLNSSLPPPLLEREKVEARIRVLLAHVKEEAGTPEKIRIR